MRLHRAAERVVARHAAQLDEGLALEGRGFAARPVVVAHGPSGLARGPLLAVGPQPQVDVEDALLAGLDELRSSSCTRSSKKTPFSIPSSRSCARSPVDHQQLEVGGVAHLAAPELARARARPPGTRGRRRSAAGRAPPRAGRAARARACSTTASARSARASEKRSSGQTSGSSRCFMSMSSICSSLSSLRSRLRSSGGGAAGEAARRVFRPRASRSQELAGAPLAEHRQQVLELHPQEVLPQEGAASPGAGPARAGPLRPAAGRARASAARRAIARSRNWSKDRRARAGSGAEGRRWVNCLMRATATRRACWSSAPSILPPVAMGDPEAIAGPRCPGSRCGPGERRPRAWRGRWRGRRGSPGVSRPPHVHDRPGPEASLSKVDLDRVRGRAPASPRTPRPATSTSRRLSRSRASSAPAVGHQAEQVEQLALERVGVGRRPSAAGTTRNTSTILRGRRPWPAAAAARGPRGPARPWTRRARTCGPAPTRCRGRGRRAGRRGSRTRRSSRRPPPPRRSGRPAAASRRARGPAGRSSAAMRTARAMSCGRSPREKYSGSRWATNSSSTSPRPPACAGEGGAHGFDHRGRRKSRHWLIERLQSVEQRFPFVIHPSAMVPYQLCQ